MSLPAQPSWNLRVIYAAAFLRSLGVGLTGVVLGIYLSRTGYSATLIGLVIASGLAGAALGTVIVSLRADQVGRRRTLVGLSLLAGLGGLAFALSTQRFSILLFAFLGMLNGMGTDRGPAFALEQAIVPQLTSTERRTVALAWYALVLDAGHALGCLAAVLPILFQRWLKADLLLSYKLTFSIYAGLNLLAAVLYPLLSPQVESTPGGPRPVGGRSKISPQTKTIVTKLAALSGMDSLGGGFLSDALVAYWFFRRFGVPESSLGLVFFFGHVLNSSSYLIAVWLARRIGLVKTMVFSHIPANLFLMAVPFAPSFAWAVAFFLARESLVEMDVPTRQSYIVGVVQPNERTFSSGVTNVTRNISRAVSPSFAGYLMQQVGLAAPLFVGSGIKIAYDLALYGAFRSLKPPEELAASHSSAPGTVKLRHPSA
jgi:MFS family permease